MNGSGTPVNGTDEVMTAKFISAWIVIQLVIPVARSRLNVSGALDAILIPR